MIPEQVRDVTVVHTASLIVPIPSPTIWYFLLPSSSVLIWKSFFLMSSSNPSVFFFFLLLRSLSESLESIRRKLFLQLQMIVFCHVLVFLIVSMQIEFLDTPEAWVIIFHVDFHGLGFIILSSEEMSPENFSNATTSGMLKSQLDCILGWWSSLRHVKKCTFLSS